MKKAKKTAGKTATKKAVTKKAATKKSEAKDVKKEEVKDTKKEEAPKETVKEFKPKKSERDTTTYNFEGVEYGKGRLMLAIVASWIKHHPKADIKKLEEAFPHLLVHRYGVFAPLKEAVEKSNPRKRYFTDEKDILEINGKKICVCNQITGPIITKFIEHCATLGLKVK